MRELRTVLRSLARKPLAPVFAAVTLALGVATALAAWLTVHAVVLDDLPYRDAEQLLLIWRGTSDDPTLRGPLSPGDWMDVRTRATSFSHVGAVNSYSTTLLEDGADPAQVQLGAVTGNFFATMGFRTVLGRGLEGGDDRVRTGPEDIGVLVLDHAYWQDRFGGDPSVLGRSVRLGGTVYSVIGVTAPGTDLLMPVDAGMATDLKGWVPFDVGYAGQPRDGAYLRVVARLRPGVSVGSANAELGSLADRLREEHPEHRDSGFRLRALPLQEDVVAHVRPTLFIVAIGAGVLLLVACANVATLMLVRFLGRRTDMAVRIALGAGRRQLVRHGLAEGAAVCLPGTVLGVLVTGPAIRTLTALQPGIFPRADAIALDASALLPAAVIGGVATVLCSAAPLAFVLRDRVGGLLRSRSGSGAGRRWLRPGLLSIQVVSAFLLLYGGASLLRSLAATRTADLGFEGHDVLTGRISLPLGDDRRPPAEWVEVFRTIEERVTALPAVAAAGLTSDLPTEGDPTLEPWLPADADARATWGSQTALTRIVSPAYFDALAVNLRAGRALLPSDGPDDARVAVVDEAFAASLGSSPADAVGREIDVTTHDFSDGYQVLGQRVRIVGVAATVPHAHPAAAPPGTVYRPLAQYPLWALSIVARGADANALRSAVREVAPSVPVTGIRTLEGVVGETLALTRFLLALVVGLAAVVMGLTAAGLLGLTAEVVLQRRRELGIRMALGADGRRVVVRVLAGGLAVVAIGTVPGVALTPLMGRALRDALGYGPSLDLVAVLVAGLSVALVAALACWWPAQGAARIAPSVVLRED